MGIFRSEEMGYYNLMMPAESAYVIMDEIGNMSSCQFVDLNPSTSVFNRMYANYLKRCDEAERRLRFFESEMQRFRITPIQGTYQQYRTSQQKIMGYRDQPPDSYIEEVERELQQKEILLIDQRKTFEQLQERHNNLTELQEVLIQAQEFLSSSQIGQMSGEGITQQLLDRDQFYESSGWDHLTGIVNRQGRESFKRMVFRASRGNALTLFREIEAPMEDPFSGEDVYKDVFILFFETGTSDTLRNKLIRITESSGVKRHEIDRNTYGEQLEKIHQEIQVSSDVLQQTKLRIDKILNDLKKSSTDDKDGHSRLCQYQ